MQKLAQEEPTPLIRFSGLTKEERKVYIKKKKKKKKKIHRDINKRGTLNTQAKNDRKKRNGVVRM